MLVHYYDTSIIVTIFKKGQNFKYYFCEWRYTKYSLFDINVQNAFFFLNNHHWTQFYYSIVGKCLSYINLPAVRNSGSPTPNVEKVCILINRKRASRNPVARSHDSTHTIFYERKRSCSIFHPLQITERRLVNSSGARFW